MKHKYIGQQETKDCAVACLYNIISYYNGYVSVEKLKAMLKTDKDGTTVYNIVETANKVGLESSAYKCELNDLCNLNLPIIAHIKIKGVYEHYVVVEKIEDDEVFIHDPIRGYLTYLIEDFNNEWTNIIITFKKTDKLICDKKDNIFSDFSLFLYQNCKTISIILLISIFITILSALNSMYLSSIYKKILLANKLFVLFIFLSLTKLILNIYKNNKILIYLQSFEKDIMFKTYDKILSLPLLYHHNRPVGDIITRINDVASIKEFISSISFGFIIDVIYILMIIIILLIINKTVFLLIFISSLIYILIYFLYRKSIISMSLELKQLSSISNINLFESLIGIDTIKNLNIESIFSKKIKEKYNDYLNSSFLLNKLFINYDSISNFIVDFSGLIIIFISVLLYKKNIISFSNIIFINSLIVYYFISLKNIISLDQIIIDCKNSYKRLVEIHKSQINKTSYNNKIDKIKTIKFQKLKYSYNNITPLFNNINFTIKNKEYAFIKGKSGAGKSTIFKLLMKNLICDDDMIKINNIDINKIDREEIIDNICFVSQNEYIFTDSILNNIKLYEEANEEEVNKVIKITKIDKILEDRNITLDYLLEENGHNLSGGERQKIILARSLLKNKSVLILDETMNELDVQTEREILKDIKNEYKCTLVLISHRDNNSDLFNKIIEV